jgi:uncharacterized protein YegL
MKNTEKSCEKSDFSWSFKVELHTTRKVIFFESPSHKLTLLKQNEGCTETVLELEKASQPNRDFTFVYTTEDFCLPSSVSGGSDISSTVMLSFIPKFCSMEVNDAYRAYLDSKVYSADISTVKGDYAFLLDRSGSMEGARIAQAKEALVLFLKSLPEDSFFNVVSFGSSSQRMFGVSVRNTQSNVEAAFGKLTVMSADLGGTEIYQPLSNLLKEKVHEGYPRHVFLLTDGNVSNTEGVIAMVRQNKKYCRVHCIGVGNGASLALIEGCAKEGKGKHVMISDSERTAEKVIELLEATLTPLISKVNLKCDDGESGIVSIVPNPKSIPYILRDDVVNFYITFNGPVATEKQFTFEYEDSVSKLPYKSTITVKPMTP